jgi:hypothetical protein
MPLKVRCKGCDKVLKVPDSVRGKTIQCPDCGNKIKIPAGDDAAAPAAMAKAPAAKAPVKKKVAKAAEPDAGLSGEIFANLNFDQVEHADEQICPYCATPLEEDDPVCRNCGMDVETGKMDKKEQKKRSRKGPDTAKFWKLAWSDPWQFLMEHKSLPIRTGLYWAEFTFVVAICYFMAHDYCDRGPPKTFWYFMTAVGVLGIPGWYYTLSMKLIQAELFREQVKPDRIHFDFLQNVSLGLRAIIWPIVVMLPFTLALIVIWVLGAYGGTVLMEPSQLLTMAGVMFLLPYVVFPLALVHMTAKYTYKAWIGWDLLVTFSKTAGACFYWLIQALILAGPIFGILAALHYFGGGVSPFTNTHLVSWAERFTRWCLEKAGETLTVPGDFTFEAIRVPVMMFFGFVMIFPIALIAGFPAVFLMRSNALLGYYFQNGIDLVTRIYPGTPAGFWVRLLAFWGDFALFPLSSFLVLREKKFVMIGQALNAFITLALIFQGRDSYAFKAMSGIFVAYNWWMYFAVQESGNIRTTVVKDSFGMMVTTEKGKQMTIGQATRRWFSAVITGAFGFIMCAFSPEKKALHDTLSKTKVVWQGDR